MDVVYICKPGDDNPELRYSLRSVAENLPHDRVFVAGYTPRWVRNVTSIDVEPTAAKHGNALNNLMAACEHPEVSDTFIVMNDDFFITAPVDEVPILHRGPIANVLAAYKQQFPTGSRYIEAMAETLDSLRSWGYQIPLSYEMHAPMPIHKATMLHVLTKAQRCGLRVETIHNRSLYGNLARIGGEQAEDVKVYDLGASGRILEPFVSTHDSSFRRGSIGHRIRVRFQDRSIYETGA